MTAVHKKHTERKAEEPASNAGAAREPVVVSDVVTETKERIEVIEEVIPEEAKSEAKTPEESAPGDDPLTDFKEKMIEEEEQPVSSVPSQKNFMWPILFIVFLALVLLGGVFIYKQGMNKGEKINVATLSLTPTLTPTPTVAEVDLSKYEIKILNGSKVDGEAGRQKTNLRTEGFAVSSVGNAAKSDYAKTIVQAKEDVGKDFLDKLKNVLEESFVVGEIEELPQDADSSVIIIIGSETN